MSIALRSWRPRRLRPSRQALEPSAINLKPSPQPPLPLFLRGRALCRLRDRWQCSLSLFHCVQQKFSAVPASEAPALPGDGRELISAIQKELSRLGYYDGPNSGRWSKAVRHGVREFIRRTGGRHVHHPQPSLELLASLQAANLVELEAKPENSSDRHPIRQAELRPARSPVEAIAATPQPAQSDDYLPPWMTRHASAAKSEANSAADVTPPAGARDITRQVHRKRHRRERGWNAYTYRGWGGGDWGF